MKKNICILLNGSLYKDSRAQKIAYTLSKILNVQIFSLNEDFNKLSYLTKDCDVISIRGLNYKSINHFIKPFNQNTNYFIDEIKRKKIKYDYVYCHDLDTLRTGVKLKKYFVTKLIYDIHDLKTETVNQELPSKKSFKGLIFRILLKYLKIRYFLLEKQLIKKTDLTITVNSSIADFLRKKYKGIKIEVINNYPILTEIPKEKLLREKLSLKKNDFIVLYHGNLGKGRYLDAIVESSKYVMKNIFYVIIGNGVLKNDLKQKNYTNVYFLDLVPYLDLFKYSSDANIGIVLVEHINYSKKYASANKLFEYMASNIPVIINKSPEMEKVILDANCGYILDEVTPKKIADLINNCFQNQKELQILGNNGRLFYEKKYNWSYEENILMQIFKNNLII